MFLEFSRNLSKCFFRWAYIPCAILQTQRPSFVVSFRPGSNCCSRDLIESGKVGSASESAHCPFVPAAVAWETQRFICGYVLHASCSNVDQANESFDSLQRQKPNQRGNSKHCLDTFFVFFIFIHLLCALSNFTNPSSRCRATWKLCRTWIEVQPLLWWTCASGTRGVWNHQAAGAVNRSRKNKQCSMPTKNHSFECRDILDQSTPIYIQAKSTSSFIIS